MFGNINGEHLLNLVMAFWMGGAVGAYLGWWSLVGWNIHIHISKKKRDCFGGIDHVTGKRPK